MDIGEIKILNTKYCLPDKYKKYASYKFMLNNQVPAYSERYLILPI